MIDPSFPAELVDLCHKIAPEIDQPIYVLQHPEHLPRPTTAAAYTFMGTCLPIREELIKAGQWQGPGPMLVVVDEYARDTEGNRQAYAGHVLHELSHHLPWRPVSNAPEVARSFHLRKFEIWATESEVEPTLESPPWHDHGAEFIRAALHVHFRAQWHQRPVDVHYLSIAGCNYGLSHNADGYRLALRAELGQMVDATFAEIMATEPPEEFTALFARDCAAWRTYQQSQSQESEAA